MGVSGGHNLTAGLINLKFDHLLSIIRHRHSLSGDPTRRKTVYFDASWLCRKNVAKAGGPIGAIVQLAMVFAKEEGLHIIIVCDGATRHDSKRASIKRQSERKNARTIVQPMS